MNTNSLSWRRKTARVFVKLAEPIIDDYLGVVCKLPMYVNISNEDIAVKAAPQFVDIIMIFDDPSWPDFPDLVFSEVRSYIVKRLTKIRRPRANLK